MGNRRFHPMIRSVCAMMTGVCLLLFPISASGQDLFQLAAFEYPPFYWEENGEIKGIAVDLIDELSKRMDIKTSLSIYPLKRALYYMEHGEMDGIMILIQTPERERYLNYTDPVITVRGLIWSAADRKGGAVEFEKLEDLKSYKIGVTRGYSYGEQLDAILKTMQADVSAKDINNYRKLLRDRIDIFPGNEIVAKGLFKRHPELQGKFVHSEKSFVEWDLCMGISKKSELVSRIPEINEVLADFKAEGFIRKTVEKYTE